MTYRRSPYARISPDSERGRKSESSIGNGRLVVLKRRRRRRKFESSQYCHRRYGFNCGVGYSRQGQSEENYHARQTKYRCKMLSNEEFGRLMQIAFHYLSKFLASSKGDAQTRPWRKISYRHADTLTAKGKILFRKSQIRHPPLSRRRVVVRSLSLRIFR